MYVTYAVGGEKSARPLIRTRDDDREVIHGLKGENGAIEGPK